MTLSGAIHTLDELCGDPRSGLPEEVFLFISRVTPLVNVDLLIQDEEHGTLLTWRSDDHHGAGWHVPGGIIRYQETAHRRIGEVARQELGAAVDFEPDPVAVMETIDRAVAGGRGQVQVGHDPIAVMETVDRESRGGNRGHFISLLYRCRLRSAPDPRLQAGDPPQPGSWRWHARPPVDLLKVHDMYRRFIG